MLGCMALPAGTAGAPQVLVVDGANVMGARPDGWWRDRPAAARRLWRRLEAADLPFSTVVLVLEGASRDGVPAVGRGRLRVVHAAGSGDDAAVAVTTEQWQRGAQVTVVTADRGLRGRLAATGAAAVGPQWLLARLPEPGG